MRPYQAAINWKYERETHCILSNTELGRAPKTFIIVRVRFCSCRNDTVIDANSTYIFDKKMPKERSQR